MPIRGRNLLAASFARVVLGVILMAPKFLLMPVVHVFAFLHHNSARREVRILRENLERVLGLEPGTREMKEMRRRISIHQAASSLETVRGIYRPGSVEIAGYEELVELVRRTEKQCKADGRGQLLITAHLGSWELLGRCMARATETHFHSLAKRPQTPAFTRFLEELRHRAGTGVLWIGHKSLLREMLSVLKKGEWLGLAMDQKPEGGRGPVVDFFGRKTEFVAGPAALAIRHRCPVIAAFCIREAPFRYRLLVRELLPIDHQESDEQKLTQKMANEIEEMVRRYPEQWPWTYRRWRFGEGSADSESP